MALTDTEVKKAKATGKDYQKADGRGQVLVIREAGGASFGEENLELMGKNAAMVTVTIHRSA
ncbi:MAG: hypothetical protein ACNA7G_09875 [Methylobacter sp.]